MPECLLCTMSSILSLRRALYTCILTIHSLTVLPCLCHTTLETPYSGSAASSSAALHFTRSELIEHYTSGHIVIL